MFQRRAPRPRLPLQSPLILISLLAGVALAACSGPEVAGSTTTPTASGGGSPTPTPVTCAQALPGAKAASAGAAFADLPLPASAVGTAPVKALGGGDGQFTLSDVALCSESTGAARIRTFFSALTDSGWLHSDWFPDDAEAESPCPDQSCWARDTRYVKLDQVTDKGGGVVTYHLRLATPPPAPDCSAGYNGITFPPGYYYFLFSQPAYPGITDGFDHIALPPLTQLAFDHAAGNTYAALCSAGSPAMVKAFLNKHLRAVGWVSLGNKLYSYANKFPLALEDGDGAQIKLVLHWPNPANSGG